jgi:uncharacterized membrane protein YhhN
MKKYGAMVMAIVMLAGATPAHASPRKLTGWLMVAGGGGLVAAAWDYDTSCPAGYYTSTIHTSDVNDTTCVYVGQTYSDVTDPTTTTTFKRPGLLWTGVATIGVGAVLAFWPSKKVQKATNGVTADVTPTGWRVAKTLKF